MARKHNGRHPDRGRSHYRDRLAACGQTGATVRMQDAGDLKRTQAAREARQGSPWPTTLADFEEQAAAESAGTR
jgi:hypothetical protein